MRGGEEIRRLAYKRVRSMGIDADILDFEIRLNEAILSTMEGEVAETIRSEMSRNLESYVFRRSRGPNGMGVRDKRNFDARAEQSVDTTTLTVRDIAKFQSSNQGSGKSLSVVVETGEPGFHMPGPRPFMGPTQEKMDAGAAEAALMNGLEKRGFGDYGAAINQE